MFKSLFKQRLSKDTENGAAKDTAPSVKPETAEPLKEESYQIPYLRVKDYKETALIKMSLENHAALKFMKEMLAEFKAAPEAEIQEATETDENILNIQDMFYASERALLNEFTARDRIPDLTREKMLKRLKFSIMATAKGEESQEENTLSTLYKKIERLTDEDFKELLNYIPFPVPY